MNEKPADATANALWAERFEALNQFKLREGHALVPVNHTETLRGVEIKLGSWVSYLRLRYHKDRLPQRWVEKLERLDGWAWGPLQPGPRANLQRDREIKKLRKQGRSLQEIGTMFGLSRQRIHQIVSTP